MQHTKGALVPALEEPGLAMVTVEVLDRLADDLDQESIAKNTRKSYLSDWASWLYFCERHRIKPIYCDRKYLPRR